MAARVNRVDIRGEYRRLRVGSYRVLYQVKDDVITIERVDRAHDSASRLMDSGVTAVSAPASKDGDDGHV